MGKTNWWDVVLAFVNLGFVIYLCYTNNWVLLVGFWLAHGRIDRVIARTKEIKNNGN